MQFPAKAETMETGEAISIVNTGYLPFIPFTTQYKMGLGGKNKSFLVPTTKNLSEIGKAGKLDWGWQADSSNSTEFAPNISRYNTARAGQDRQAEPGYGLYDEKLEAMGAFGAEKFQDPQDRGKKDTDQLHQDLRFTPNSTMAARSSAMAAELANIINSTSAPASTSNKEDTEMEEEAILDLFYESDVPELQAIMQEARAKAESGNISVLTRDERNKYGLSHETYDWTVKDLEDMTKMHALMSIMNQHIQGDLLSDNIAGIEVTKDIKFFAKDREAKDYGDAAQAEKSESFLKDTRKEMKSKFDNINKQIKKYLTTVGHMHSALAKTANASKPDTLEGFTIQTISRAREALLHPGGNTTYGFQFPMGTKAEGGPYQVILEIIPMFDQEQVLQGVDHTVGIIEMAGYEGARSKLQPGIANLLLKHMNETLKLDSKITLDILNRAAILVGTELQQLAGRGSMLVTRFTTDFAMLMADSYMAYTTMTSTMTNKEVSQSLFDMIMDKSGNPEQKKALAAMMEEMFNDSSSLTSQWKDKVGGNDYTVPQYVWAKGGGPFSGGGVGEGVAITPFIGSSRQMSLMQSLQKTPKGQKRVGQAVKNPVRRMTGETPTPTDVLATRGWMSKAFGANPSESGFKDVSGDGVIRLRESWFKKYGASRKIKEYNPYTDKI